MPVVAMPSSFPAEVRSNAPRAEHDRSLQLVLVFPAFGHRSVASIFIRHRPHELAVAVPAALSDIHFAPLAQGGGAKGHFVGGRQLAPVLVERLAVMQLQTSELYEHIVIDFFLGRALGQMS